MYNILQKFIITFHSRVEVFYENFLNNTDKQTRELLITLFFLEGKAINQDSRMDDPTKLNIKNSVLITITF